MLSDHKSLLEKTFKDFACLTTGDTIVINHKGEKYLIDIVETKPSHAISLFDIDCEVDFATPLDYKEPLHEMARRFNRQVLAAATKVKENDRSKVQLKKEPKEFKAFTGKSFRLM
ncbi:ubiquitin fusion degradation protein 1 [Tanacetum coccineum]